MEYEDRELAGAARSAHVLHITPRASGESARIIQAALGKTADSDTLATVIAVPDRQTAYTLTSFARSNSLPLAPLTVTARATRLLQRPVAAVIGTPSDLIALVRTSALKLESVQHIVLLWADALLADERQRADLDTLLSEASREADRTLVVEQSTPEVEAFIERVALKPRRLTHSAPASETARSIGYMLVAAEQRASLLQRLVDARDGGFVLVIADDERAAGEATVALEALGMDVPSDARVANSQYTGTGKLVIWYGVPGSLAAGFSQETEEAAASEVIALVTASELARLRASGVTTQPVSLPHAMDEAGQRQRALRDELNSVLRRESVDAELATIEPLLGEHDAAEVAAAALRILGRARRRIEASVAAPVAAAPAATSARATAPAEEPHWTRLFVSVGERDGARRGDLVGAITGEAEITGAQVGKVDMRDSYSLVDVAASVAEKVVERLTGVSIKGRRVTARLERSGAGGAPPRSGGREGRRGPPRRDFDRAERGQRSGPRAARESEEWSTRGERLRHARRPPRGDDA